MSANGQDAGAVLAHHASLTEAAAMRSDPASITARLSRLLLPLVLTALVLMTLVLASQAYVATVYQQEVAEEVLRDYAELVALTVEQRVRSGVGYSLYQERNKLQFFANTPPAVEPGGLILGTLRLDLATGHMEWTLPESPDRDEYAAVVRGMAGETRFIVRPLHDGGVLWLNPSAIEFQSGMVVGPVAWRGLIEAQLTGQPLLPPSLVPESRSRMAVGVRVSDATGALLWHAGPDEVSDLRATLTMGDDYGGAFSGYRIEAWIDPAYAHHLVIGGLPSSRLPWLLGLAGGTLLLLIIAVLQVRDERRLARLREDFVAQVSHELRTPLTQIRMFTETLLLDRVRDDEQRSDALRIIDRETRRLSHLVENVLQFSRSQRESQELQLSATAVVPLVRDVVEGFRPLLKQQRLVLETEISEEQELALDPDALRQVLLNLLDNALRYGPADQIIRVRVSDDVEQQRIRIQVHDQGPGIPASDHENIFSPYHRLGRERDRAIAGTGIGLAVVRDLMRRMGGEARVIITEQGACFDLLMPAARPIDKPSA
jgi:signal transduction histidine kinase